MNKFIILFASAILLVACTSPKDQLSFAESISVRWELVTNFTDEHNVFEAKFDITNNGDFALSNKNWTLFFNMAPRKLLEPKIKEPASLHHINGDWYKLVPNENFNLEPGQSITIGYRGVEAVIKETDRPLGLYIVFYDDNGAEKKIVEVMDYTWAAFDKPEQINRNAEDEEPIPTAEWVYKTNADAGVVPDSELKQVIPSPVNLRMGRGTLDLSNEMEIYFQNGLENEAKYLAASLKDLTGKEFKTVTTPSSTKLITLWLKDMTVSNVSKEAYSLEVAEDGIAISGSDAAGVFYGIQSLRALVPIEAYQKKSSIVSLPHVFIEDAPRFSFRGLHLDVSRNFQTKETILRLLDLLSFYKINRFLFYTTEDEGWRLEIKDLPELTSVGAQREHTAGKETAVLHPAYGSGPFAKAEGKFGHGYYSRKDFIEILKYANERHIKVIPELNFPGHARAAIKAMEARYEKFMKDGKEAEANEYRLIDPQDASVYLSAQGYKDNVVSVARESVFHFYEKVVDEITAMYAEAGLKLDEFHTGGDEVPEGAWTKSPLAAELMTKHPEIRDPKNLQAYFFRELLKRLKKRNLQVHGWEEVALMKTSEGEYVPNPEFAKENVVPYIWNNMFDYPDLGYRLANAGYSVVLCNVSNFYFDLAYNKDPKEPGLYWAGFVDTRHAWTFAPYDMFKTTTKNSMGQKLDLETGNMKAGGKSKIIVEHLRPEARKNILGIEAQVWSETIKGREMLEYYTLPKLIGFSESAWAAERKWETIEDKTQRETLIQQEWNVYANSLAKKELPRLSYLNGGYHYRIPSPGAIVENGKLKANVAYPGLIIRYTTDGTEPTLNSLKYENPVDIKGTILLKSFDASGKASRVVQVN
ncbi:family 20 glycosylhydrolase [Chryseolinea sp. H1M3-3]|uniref:family 20 glycosylhydrolase n=1 Tax=Chryseolinea sp. H1M3-3 TaxID=3034144 RepID=UPI0023EAF7B2|nr:family 20 glycosylhydrolase [Chryseolinea sp. H1M3-3]